MQSKNDFVKYEKAVPIPRGESPKLPLPKRLSDIVKTKYQIGELLNTLFPPRIIEEDGKQWLQKVSKEAATNNDILDLTDQLDIELKERGASSIGICDMKKQAYIKCLDELIRQEIIECPDRGLLMKKVKEELLLTMKAMDCICRSVFAYGLSKVLHFEDKKVELEEQLLQLQGEHDKLVEDYHELKRKLEEVKEEAQNEEKKQLENYLVQEEILEERNQLLEKQLQTIVDPRTFKIE